MGRLKLSTKQKKAIAKEVDYDLMPPEKKYHTNKQQASRNITNYLHQLLVEIAPMSKREIRNIKTNGALIDKIMAIFKTNDAKYLYAKCPQNAMGSTIFYLQYDDMYTGDSDSNGSIETTKLINSNYQSRSDFLATKNVKTKLNHLKKMGYKYLHFYAKWTWTPTKEHDALKNNNVIYTQINVPTKRDLLKIIRKIAYDVSMYHIKDCDQMALEDYRDMVKKRYHKSLAENKRDKVDLKNYNQRLAKLRNYFKNHKRPYNSRKLFQ